MEIALSTAFFRQRMSSNSCFVRQKTRGIYGRDFYQHGRAEYLKTGPLANTLTKRQLDLIERARFRYLELDPGVAIGAYRQECLGELAREFEMRGMTVHSIHELVYNEVLLNSLNEKDRRFALDNDKKQIDRLHIFRPKLMVVHPGIPSNEPHLAKRQQERCRASLDELAHYCGRKSITLAVENQTHPRFVEYLMELLAPFGSEDVGICFDTGHPHRIGEDIVEKVSICKERLFALHCSDNQGKGSADEHTIPYHGTINWGRFYATLEEIRYPGVLVYECNYQPHPERALVEIAQSFSRMRDNSIQFMESVLWSEGP